MEQGEQEDAMSKVKVEITAEGIAKIVQDHKMTSLTQVSKALKLGTGAVSGSVAKRIRALVPNVTDLLASNKLAKDAPAVEVKPPAVKKAVKQTAVKTAVTPAVKKPAGKTAYPIPEICPYRHSGDAPSGYAKCWAILFAHRASGISKPALIEKYRAWTGKPQKNAEFDCHVVTSPKEDGSAHRSASRASGVYYCIRENNWVKLVLVSEKKG